MNARIPRRVLTLIGALIYGGFWAGLILTWSL